jgi:hypothetical protein
MTKRKLVSTAMIAAAMLATPVMAREGLVAQRHTRMNIGLPIFDQLSADAAESVMIREALRGC